MDVVETLVARNARFAESDFDAGLKIRPKLATVVICCADTRVDPATVLGTEPGEVMALRNVGGRVTPSVLVELFMLRRIARAVDDFANWDLIVMQHTQCGILKIEDRPELLAPFFQIDESAIASVSVGDPHAAVAHDVTALRADKRFEGDRVSGLVYDVTTGRVERVA